MKYKIVIITEDKNKYQAIPASPKDFPNIFLWTSINSAIRTVAFNYNYIRFILYRVNNYSAKYKIKLSILE